MHRLRARTASLVAVLGLAVAGCGDEVAVESAGLATTAPATMVTATTAAPVSTDPATSDPTAVPPTTGAASVEAPEVLRFSAPLVGGGTFDGAAVAGKPVAFWFWAPG